MATEIPEVAKEKPFSIGYVLRITAKHMRRSVDISIRKTFERAKEFEKDPVKANECFHALSILHQMRKNLEEFQAQYPEDFNRE